MYSGQSRKKDSYRRDITASLTGTSLCTYAIEPPCTERYARWCERSGLFRPLLLDLRCRSATDQNSEDFSVRAAVSRFGMPCRCVKDCRVGRTRPPRNDKIGRFCGKAGRSVNSKVWNFPQGDISIVTLLGRYIMRPTGRISYARAYIIQP